MIDRLMEMDIDDLRSHCLELVRELDSHLKLVRDYAVTPGNAWLARNELNKISRLMTDLEAAITAIKRAEEK